MGITSEVLKIAIYVTMIICGLLFTLAMILTYNTINKNFKCPKCNKINKVMYKKCTYCENLLYNPPKSYKTLFRIKFNCKNKEGNASYTKTMIFLGIDILFVIAVLCIGVTGLAITITNLIG